MKDQVTKSNWHQFGICTEQWTKSALGSVGDLHKKRISISIIGISLRFAKKKNAADCGFSLGIAHKANHISIGISLQYKGTRVISLGVAQKRDQISRGINPRGVGEGRVARGRAVTSSTTHFERENGQKRGEMREN